jgi:hypothetical protein
MRQVVWLLCLAALLRAERVAIVGAAVIDGTGAAPRSANVLINDGVIEAVGAAVPEGVRVLDAKGLTLMPGLIDVHTHLLASAGRVHADWGKNLKAYLLSGVNTLFDLSTYPEQFEPIRRLLASGLPGPRVLMAARLSTPAGHGAEAGRDHSELTYLRTKRPDGSRALTVLCKASVKASAMCAMVLPLSKGSVESVDASAFTGVEFEVRGEGKYTLQVPARSIRERNYYRAEFAGDAEWQKVRVPFSELKRTSAGVSWTGTDLLNLEFMLRRTGWFELDNVRFYR